VGGFVVLGGGTPAVLIPVHASGPGSRLLDVCATTLTEPRQTFTLRGEAGLLGLDHFDRADIQRTRLRLYRDPIIWLQAGGQGCAVCDWLLAAPMLAGLSSIVCDDADQGDEVRNRLLRWGRCPSLFIIAQRRAA
jgi:hypothetical protein